jgi:hypothetical protein
MNLTSRVFVMALAAGSPAAAQSLPQPPVAPVPAPAGAQAPAPAPSVPASRKFTSDSGIMFNVIKPDKTADFEAVMARVKEALGKSQDQKRKQQALSWRVLKGLEPGPGGNVIYIFWFDPAVKDEEYTITDILREAFPNEAQDLWAKLTACYASGMVMLNLQQTTNMSPNATAIPK